MAPAYDRGIFRRTGGFEVSTPDLPGVARTILKGAIMGLVNASLITSAAADQLIDLLGLSDA